MYSCDWVHLWPTLCWCVQNWPSTKPGGGTRFENCWGCAAGHWKLDPKRSRERWYFGAKKIEFSEDLYPKDRFCVGGWEKTPQKDRVWYPEGLKRGSKLRHICITHHIGSTPPGYEMHKHYIAGSLKAWSPSASWVRGVSMGGPITLWTKDYYGFYDVSCSPLQRLAWLKAVSRNGTCSRPSDVRGLHKVFWQVVRRAISVADTEIPLYIDT